MSDLLENNAYPETTDVTPTKIGTKKRKRLIKVIVIICIYALLTFIGFLPYPKLYQLGMFYLNKSSFEYIKDSGENFYNSVYDKYDFSECSDPKLAKSIKTVIRCHYGKASWDSQSRDDKVLVFYTDNTLFPGNARGILYSEKEIEWFDDFYYDCKCKPLGGGWYYYYAARKGEYYRDKRG